MYVRPYTTWEEIEKEIVKLEEELHTHNLPKQDVQTIVDELDYLYSFQPKEY